VAGDPDGVADRVAGQHRDAEAESVGEVGLEGGVRVVLQASVDDDHLVALGIEVGADGHQRQREGVEDRPRVVEDDFASGRRHRRSSSRT
jgi:hypothetical protein